MPGRGYPPGLLLNAGNRLLCVRNARPAAYRSVSGWDAGIP